MTLLLVALLGGLGAAARFVVDRLIRGRWSRVFPLATVLINVSGSALLGLLSGAMAYHSLAPNAYLVASVGFCGGYTTFSTAMVETVRLAQQGDYRRSVVNALGTFLLAVGAAALGVLVMWLLA